MPDTSLKPQSSRSCTFDAEKLNLKLSVTLSADRNAIDPVVRNIMNVVREMNCAAGSENEIELALSEALANGVGKDNLVDAVLRPGQRAVRPPHLPDERLLQRARHVPAMRRRLTMLRRACSSIDQSLVSNWCRRNLPSWRPNWSKPNCSPPTEVRQIKK